MTAGVDVHSVGAAELALVVFGPAGAIVRALICCKKAVKNAEVTVIIYSRSRASERSSDFVKVEGAFLLRG